MLRTRRNKSPSPIEVVRRPSPRNPRIAVSKLLEGIAAPTLSDCAKIWRDALGRYANRRIPSSQDSDPWEFLNHLTISRDRTANSNYAKEQLAVLIASPLNAHEETTKERIDHEPIESTETAGADLKPVIPWDREELLNILDDFPSWASEQDEQDTDDEDDEDNNETTSGSGILRVKPWSIDTDLHLLSKKLSNASSEGDTPRTTYTRGAFLFRSVASTPASAESDFGSSESYMDRGILPVLSENMDSSSEREDGDDALILRRLLDQMESLRVENRRLKDKLSEAERKAPKIEQELPPTFQVFHRLSPSEVSVYPPTRMVGENDTDESILRLDVTLASLDRYLEKHPEIVFAVFKDYQRKVKNDIQGPSKDGNETQAETLAPLEPYKESIRLTSEGMKEAFKACMELWPDFSSTLFPTFDINAEIPAPYMFWHHYQSSYTSIAPQLNSHHRDLMDRLTRWIQDHYSEEYNQANASLSKGLVSYKTMPYLVRPGDVLAFKDASGVLNGYMSKTWVGPPADIVSHAVADDSPDQTADGSKGHKHATSVKYEVKCWAWEYNGTFNSKTRTIPIHLEYNEPDEEIDITSLNAYPLKYAKISFQYSLRRRGEIYWSCRFQKLVEYHEINPKSLATVIERYMVDYATYKKLHGQPEQGILINAGESYKLSEDQGPQGDEIYLFPPKVTCYSLVRKSWVDLHIDRMYDVQWDKAAFDNLVIDRDTKELILALVMNQLEAERATDIISGKGNGLIMLLHGGPGTGKTFTAEAVAEIAEKPLYRVTCGDVGTKPEAVERYLESVLHLGKIWGCVVLLDEADVFLEERTLSQLERNALVSVFLRVLEYYEGILILTSNRVGTFDEAFKSRIQLALHYKNLSDTQRRRIWSNFLNRLQNMERGDEHTTIDFDDLFDHIDELATKYVMNGRQIRNVITTARQLAKHRKKVMTFSDLHHVIEVSSRFDKYLQDVKEGLTDDEVARSYGKR